MAYYWECGIYLSFWNWLGDSKRCNRSLHARVCTFRDWSVFNPIEFALLCWFYDFGGNYDLLLDDDERSVVSELVAVVGARADRDELALSKLSVEATDAVLVRPNDGADCVGLEELVHPVRPELHDVVLPERISDCVVLNTLLFISVGRVTPKKVHDYLMVL